MDKVCYLLLYFILMRLNVWKFTEFQVTQEVKAVSFHFKGNNTMWTVFTHWNLIPVKELFAGIFVEIQRISQSISSLLFNRKQIV